MHDNPDDSMACCLELMRYVAMSASQPRIVAEDFEWHGKQLKKDEVIFLMMAAGNRDPRVYEDPETLDLTRTNDQSFSKSIQLRISLWATSNTFSSVSRTTLPPLA